MEGPHMGAGQAAQEQTQSLQELFRHLGGIGILLRSPETFGLTEEQENKLEAMRETFEIERLDNQTAYRKAEAKLRALLKSETATEQDIVKAIDEVCARQGDLWKRRYRNLQKTRSVLKDEQRKKLRAFRRRQEQEKTEKLRQQPFAV